MRCLFLLGMALGAMAILGCSSPKTRNYSQEEWQAVTTTNTVVLDSMAAVEALTKLYKAGLLPGAGFGKAKFVSDEIQLKSAEAGRFPQIRTFQFIKEDEPSVIRYALVRSSAEDQWRLQRAWRTTYQGELIHELPLR